EVVFADTELGELRDRAPDENRLVQERDGLAALEAHVCDRVPFVVEQGAVRFGVGDGVKRYRVYEVRGVRGAEARLRRTREPAERRRRVIELFRRRAIAVDPCVYKLSDGDGVEVSFCLERNGNALAIDEYRHMPSRISLRAQSAAGSGCSR